MKLLDITLKDLQRSFRSAFALFFMLVVPILTTAIFYFAFGGSGGDGNGFDLPTIELHVANDDEAQAQFGGFSAGQVLVDLLSSEELGDLLHVTVSASSAEAKAAVDAEVADVALIIPAGFTVAIFGPSAQTSVALYQDPTLTIGPGIVKGVVSQFIDGLAGAKLASRVAGEELVKHGIEPDASTLQAIATRYGNWASSFGSDSREGASLLDIQSPGEEERRTPDQVTQILTLNMAGMMIFYAFFTGASTAQTILKEEEDGTLRRLFTTATPHSTILGGKLLASFLTVLVQVVVLLLVAIPIFDVRWGQPSALALVTPGLVVLAGGFGVFVTSFMKDLKQAGFVFGGILSVTGMPAIFGMVTAGSPGPRKVMDIITLLVPQGWATRAWRLAIEGAGASEVLPWSVAMLGLGLVLFAIGVLKYRKRYA